MFRGRGADLRRALAVLILLGFSGFICVPELSAISASKGLKKVANTLKKKGLKSVPSVGTTVSTNTSTSSQVAYASLQCPFEIAPVVSGTPPLLIDVPGSEVKNLFWRPGVVDALVSGSATPEQCREFFPAPEAVDGHSGGLGACHMAEGVGRSFQSLLHSETSLCLMRNLPTKANYAAGALQVVSGKLPNGNITKLFAPGKSPRLVKINPALPPDAPDNAKVPAKIFVKVPSKSENRRAGYYYQAELCFCPTEDAEPDGYNIIQVSSGDAKLRLILGHPEDLFGGSISHTVEGYLTFSEKAVHWDSTRSRRSVIDTQNDFERFKAEFEITADNLIVLKGRSERDFNNQQMLNKVFTITRFRGEDVNSVAFLEGAFKAQDQSGLDDRSFTGSTEFRDTFYASAPNNEILNSVREFEFDSDLFYSELPFVTPDVSPYSCTATPDIEINMVPVTALAEALSPCFQQKFRSMDFCREGEQPSQEGGQPTLSDIGKALQNIRDRLVCAPPGGGPPGP